MRQSMQPWFLRSLARFYALLALVLAIPAVLILVFGIGFLKTRALETAEFQNRVSAYLIGQALMEVLDGLTHYVESYARREGLVEALQTGDEREARRHLEELKVGNMLKVGRVVIAGPSGKLLYDYPVNRSMHGRSYKDIIWFREASLKGGTHISPIYERISMAGEATNVVAISTPIQSGGGELLGYLSAQVEVTDLEEWLTQVKPSTEAEVMLLDQKDSVIRSENSRSLSEEEAAGVRDRLAGESGSYQGEHLIGSKESLVSWLRLGDPGWTVVVSQPREAVLVPVQRLTGTLVSYMLISAGVTALIGYVSYSALRKYENARRQDEAELRRGAEELRRSNHELEQFAYVASHDLQEPLRMVSNYCQLLARRYKGKLGQEADDFISFAVDGARRMQLLIEDLLAYSRVGSKPAELKPADMNEVFETAARNLEVTIREADAEVTKAQLPVVMADYKQLVQLLQNLIANAIKFRSERRPAVAVSAFRKEREWLFAVTDNGIGIDPEFSEKVFVIFQRLHSRGDYPGTGIGLAICKKVAERHGGRIWVESEPGKGSAFYFTIPAAGAGS